MSAAVAVAIGIGTAVASLGSAIFGASSASKRAKRAEKEKNV
jgi:F0F1-type ATP synthase membrane subunit c/vacuolar-type H+-ATPase subunit K